jgi:hypothetical protein
MMHLLKVVGSGRVCFIPNRRLRTIVDHQLLAAGKAWMARALYRQSGLCGAFQAKKSSAFLLRPICLPVKCREFPSNH